MAELPILFSAPMVRAILREIEQPGAGKTQTRRILVLRRYRRFSEFGPSDTAGYEWHLRDSEKRWHDLRHPVLLDLLPYKSGDRLYVREAWHAARSLDSTPPRDIPRDADIEHAATARGYAEIGLKGKLRPAMFLPRWASRITLTVTEVRVQRLQETSEGDAWAEGCKRGTPRDTGNGFFPADEPAPDGRGWIGWDDAREWFADLWDSLNAKRGYGWEANPWVAAYTFRPILGNIDQVPA